MAWLSDGLMAGLVWLAGRGRMTEREVPIESDAALPDGLIDTFWRYEQALMADDVLDPRPALRGRPAHTAR